jgi:YVTN family beta-propeller protein
MTTGLITGRVRPCSRSCTRSPRSRARPPARRSRRTATNQAGPAITEGYGATAIAITPDGSAAYVVNYFGGSVSLISTASNKVAATIKVGSYPWAIAICP